MNPNRDAGNKFKIACQKIEDSAKKYISSHQIEVAEESDEDEDEHQSEIIESIVGSYNKEGDDLARTNHFLQESFRNGTLVCLVCIENIKKEHKVWNCDECYCTFHLGCVHKWAKDSIYIQSRVQEEEEQQHALNMATTFLQAKTKKNLKWFCPKCRHSYSSLHLPREYVCFCGKAKDPPFDPWLFPHSCGNACGKPLRPACGHSCLLLCHPGPCPPCPVTVRHPCFCGKATPAVRRCSSKTWSCGAVCGRRLACGKHKCGDRCHSGPCGTCKRRGKHKCACGAEAQERACADAEWHCDKVCGKAFACGHHKCDSVCHSVGQCGDCPLQGRLRCPCGKSALPQDFPCTAPLLTCGDTCGKPLSCAFHFCAERCHKGACPSCLQVRVKKCNCGAHEKELPCSKNFTCESKCKNVRDCRKHTCNRKCCTGDCPSCDHPCGKTLGCGQHKCESRCHQMRCYPCSVTHEVACSCGATRVTVPCGRERKTPRPKCSVPCKRKTVCHHPKAAPHACHEDKCPPCKFVCGRALAACTHVCPAKCHHAVPVKVGGGAEKRKRAGPWEKVAAPQIEIRKQPCPPCMVEVPNTCLGQHETTAWRCSEVRPFSCARKCGRALGCSHHTCARECHAVEGAKDERSHGLNCKPCTRRCEQDRLTDCPHHCQLTCHVEPCPKCDEKVKLQCHCNLLPITVDCHKWATLNPQTREKMRSCTNQCNKKISCGHRCLKQCHSGKCSPAGTCKKKVGIRCPCKRIRKDFLCHVVNASRGEVLACDDGCAAKEREKKEAEELCERKLKEEEEAARVRELEEFQRFVEGRKRKKSRKNTPVEEGDAHAHWWRRKEAAIFLLAVLVLFLALYWTR